MKVKPKSRFKNCKSFCTWSQLQCHKEAAMVWVRTNTSQEAQIQAQVQPIKRKTVTVKENINIYI